MGIWIGYILGQVLHIALRAQNILRSPKNECVTLDDWARKYGLESLARIGLATVGLEIWLRYPDTLNAALGVLGIPAVPLMWATAFAWGLAAEVLLDSASQRLPALRRILRGNGHGGNGGSA